MKLSYYKHAVLALIFANIVWGVAGPIYQWALTDIPPFSFAFLRFFLAALILLPFTMHSLKIRRKDFFKIFMLAFVSIPLHIGYLYVGLTLSSSLNVAIISSAGPVFLLLGSFFYLREKLNPKLVTGLLISLMGVLLIIMRPIFENNGHLDGSIVGNILFVISVITSTLYLIMLKKYSLKYNPFALNFWVFFIGSLLIFPFVIWELQGIQIANFLTFKVSLSLFYGAIFSSALAWVLYTYAIKYIRASEIGIFSYIDPIATVLVALPLLGEQITSIYIIGSAFVFLGIFIAEGRLHYHPLHLLRSKNLEAIIEKPPREEDE